MLWKPSIAISKHVKIVKGKEQSEFMKTQPPEARSKHDTMLDFRKWLARFPLGSAVYAA